jgi:archaemetzincin
MSNSHSCVLVPLGDDGSVNLMRASYHEASRFIPDLVMGSRRDLPISAYRRLRHRYRADSIIHWLAGEVQGSSTKIGITTVDISTTKDNIADWGVMGLSYQPGHAGIASSFRLKDKEQFWKVVVHEWGHTVGLAHCMVDSCFMRDAEGKDHTAEERNFCPSCRKKLLESGVSR